ncbi:hypothetical protein M9Y10_028671 [Tritrichomonas musculus]|uniref:General transcription factor TFIIB n=1 Tax=Tritrichomonas musculus TaxID=1915356 RepID=A0ABR2KKQ7_9EUKA
MNQQQLNAMTRDLIQKEKCPNCGREHVIKESPRTGEYYCSNCGYVSDFPYIDETSEYRQFAIDHGVKDKSRSSNAGDEMVEELFTGIEYDGSAKSKKMARINQRIQQDPKKAKLKHHVRSIRNLCGQLQLSKAISDRACELYKEAFDADLVKKKRGEALNVACIFYACQAEGYPKTMKEILAFTDNLSKREMDKEMETIKHLKSLENVQNYWENLLKRYCHALNLSKDVTTVCYDTARYLRELGFGESLHPNTKVATIIAYVTSKSPDPKDHRTFEEISEKVGPKKDTIATRMKDLQDIPNIQKLPSFVAFLNKTV